MNNKGPNRGLEGRSAVLGAALLSAIALGGCDGAQADTRNGVNATLADTNGADEGVDSNQVTLSPGLEELRANLEVQISSGGGGISVGLSSIIDAELNVVYGDEVRTVALTGSGRQNVPFPQNTTVETVELFDAQTNQFIAEYSVN